ncbi:MAG: outer membrane lipoprotein-sorting protein [Burkholderiales bacterium]|nr:outer membrane lipoprotein-sorting protein [Burkholderiales bacterium]MDE1925703.1 outer membrane lipoprotein-sorting protein [Burkholderiales bacterium]MDE2159566.1 outer membrane lipoprotein-sorting protein [Burkholderiales bacterium]MDE2504182.1 outer membrane lipoprotein-sorting protein [Burkholderiales bacterium]
MLDTPLTASATVRRALLLWVACLAGLSLPVQAAPNAQALLAASDAIRNPSQPFRVTVTLTEFEKGAQVNATTLVSYARTLENGGQFASLLRFVLPLRDAGKVMLKNGADLWFYDPATKAAVRISPQQRLMGQAANGDVVTVNFARDYRAKVATEETIQDGERKSRAAIKLLLTAAGPDATYGSIELWIDARTEAPLKARFFAESGRLLKTAYYRRFEEQLGAMRPTETVIIDGLEPQSVTLVRLSDYAARPVPSSWFQRDFLPRFTAE